MASRLGATARHTAVEKFALSTTTRSLKELLVREARVKPPTAAREADPQLTKGSRRWWFR
jgi:hypothetical protein